MARRLPRLGEVVRWIQSRTAGSGWALGVAIAALVVALAGVGLSLRRRRV